MTGRNDTSSDSAEGAGGRGQRVAISIELAGHTLECRMHAATVAYVRQYFEGFATLRDERIGRGPVVTVLCDAGLATRFRHLSASVPPAAPAEREEHAWTVMDVHRLRVATCEAGVHVVWESENQPPTIVVPDTTPRSLRVVVRLLRARLEAMLVADGRIPVHAACVAVSGQAVALIGGERHGKTTMLLHLLDRGGHNFVANDRIYLGFQRGQLRVQAVPVAVGIRADVVGLFRQLAMQTPETSLRHPDSWLTKAQHEQADIRTHLHPQELAAAFNCAIMSRATLAYVVAVEFDHARGHPRIERLPVGAAGELLNQHYLQELAETPRPWRPIETRGHRARRERDARQLTRWAAAIPALRLAYGAGSGALAAYLLELATTRSTQPPDGAAAMPWSGLCCF